MRARVALDGPVCELKEEVVRELRRRRVVVAEPVFVDVPSEWDSGSALAAAAWVHQWARVATTTSATVLLDSPLASLDFHPQHAEWLAPLSAATLAQTGVRVVLVGGETVFGRQGHTTVESAVRDLLGRERLA